MAEYLGVAKECVKPTAGGISAIQLANRIASSETVLLTPCFCEYEQFATSAVRKVSLLQEQHEIVLPKKIELKENSLVWLYNPMNPVGQAFARPEIEAILKQVEVQNSWLLMRRSSNIARSIRRLI